jgi:hypothetical protein
MKRVSFLAIVGLATLGLTASPLAAAKKAPSVEGAQGRLEDAQAEPPDGLIT